MTLVLALQGAVPRSADRVERELSQSGVTRWRYVGENAAWRVAAEHGGALAGVPRVAQGERLGELAEELRVPYLDWIGELSVANASPAWWASDLAAKNPFTWHYARVCALGAALEAIADDAAAGTLVVCSTPALLAELRDAADARGVPVRVAWERSAARLVGEHLAMRSAWRALAAWSAVAPRRIRGQPARLSRTARFALDRTPGHRRRTLADLGIGRGEPFGGDGASLLVTWVDARSFSADGSYRDPHLGPLADLLRERGQPVALLPRVLPTADFASSAKALAASGEPAYFPDAYLGPEDWRACARDAAVFAPVMAPDAALQGIPVARLSAEHVAEMRRSQVEALSMRLLAQRLAEGGVAPERIVFPFEGHAWEQALTDGVRAHMPQTRVIGYDNVNFSRLALSLYPARAEIGLRPLPDRVVTNGPTFTRILTGEGYPEETVRTGCALRHVGLLDRPAAEPAPEGAPLRVLAATSIDLAQSIELVERAVAAFGGDARYELSVKLHPGADAPGIKAAVRVSGVRYIDEPIADALTRADLMLYTYSVVCYEALAQGVPAVFVQAETFLDLDQLEPFPELRRLARSAEELRAHADEVAGWSQEERAEWMDRARAAVREALTPLDEACADAFRH